MSADPEILPDGPWLVVGLGRSGISAGRLLAGCGEMVIGVDSGAPDIVDPGFDVDLNSDGVELLDSVKAVVKSPGVPPSAPVIVAARAAGMPVIGELELGWRCQNDRIVAITGTNGKTTVTEWLGHVLRGADVQVRTAGNVGTPLTSLFGRSDLGAVTVVECSSYQLADTDLFHPDIGVLLNLGSDHLDWHGTIEDYRDAKLTGMFSRQTGTEVAIAPQGIDVPGAGKRIVLEDVELPGPVGLPGAHNELNARAVTAAARALGVSDDAIAAGLASFRGVEHRLEDLGTLDGVRYINDSKATNVASTLTALAAMDAPVHLILGGNDDKLQDFAPLREPVHQRCASVQVIGVAAPRLLAALGTGTDRGDLASAVTAASEAASEGDVVLLSPACASFGQYRNFEERGDHFKELVRRRRSNA